MREENLLKLVLQKVKEFGPRPSASRKEREFLGFLAQSLEALGLSVEWDTFRAPSTYTWAYLVLWLGLAQAGLLVKIAPLWSVVSGLFFLLVEYWELATFPVVSALFRFRESANVLGKNGEEPALILMAHVDSARTSFFFHPRFVTNPRLSLLLLVYSSLLITGSGIFSAFLKLKGFFWVALFPSLYLLFLALGHVHRESFMGFSPGGNDNGSGVAASFELARVLKKKGIPFFVVFTGAEESGTWGALRFIEKYGHMVREKPILNLDNIGIGTLTVATREGMWKIYHAAPPLLQGFQSVQDSSLSFRPYLGLSTDATPLLARGFQAVTLIALGENGLPVNWHWYSDTAEAVSEENLRRAVQLITEWVEGRYGVSP